MIGFNNPLPHHSNDPSVPFLKRYSFLELQMSLTHRIKERARELGFDLVGVAPVGPAPELLFYKDWIAAGYAGKMEYLTRNVDKRGGESEIIPDAKSVIVCAMVYHTEYPRSTEMHDPKRGWISRYAWGDDYHEILKTKLFELLAFIKTESAEEVVGRVYVDTGPVIDRVYAKYAGIGWFGKNTCIINQQKGSWFFIGEIITNLELEYDVPVPDRCGACNRCIEACPTDAILEPYVLDARKCISYLTIELREEIPLELRDGIGNHIFGCDICQDVCPWNRKAPVTESPEFQPRENFFHPDLRKLAKLSAEDFSETFHKSPIKRTKRRGLLRNVAVAMGNSGEKDFLPYLEELVENEDQIIAEHAQWAIEKIEHQMTLSKRVKDGKNH
jgi:epoxyqueuosine reductase